MVLWVAKRGKYSGTSFWAASGIQNDKEHENTSSNRVKGDL
jgi:hypothetical protein